MYVDICSSLLKLLMLVKLLEFVGSNAPGHKASKDGVGGRKTSTLLWVLNPMQFDQNMGNGAREGGRRARGRSSKL